MSCSVLQLLLQCVAVSWQWYDIVSRILSLELLQRYSGVYVSCSVLQLLLQYVAVC